MQLKKEDIKQTILNCARDEFMNHGYEDASMRVIAKKANTSLGKIYHYFPSKKAILDCLIRPTVAVVCGFIKEHAELTPTFMDMQKIDELLDEMDFEDPHMKALISKEFVIFMETKETEYVEIRNETITVFRNHIPKHMHFGDENNPFVIIVTKMLIDCVIHMVRYNSSIKGKKEDMKEMFRILCRGVAQQDCSKLKEK